MKILFDSHALVWYLKGDRRLSGRAREIADDQETEVFVSAVCAWEMAIKIGRGRWPEAAEIVSNLHEITHARAFTPLPITIEHARVAGFMSGRHRDPFDRMLAAQSQVENIPLVTVDPGFRSLAVRVLW